MRECVSESVSERESQEGSEGEVACTYHKEHLI